MNFMPNFNMFHTITYKELYIMKKIISLFLSIELMFSVGSDTPRSASVPMKPVAVPLHIRFKMSGTAIGKRSLSPTTVKKRYKTRW